MKVYKFLLLFFTLFCYADPKESDLERTIKTFLELRFHSSYEKNLSQYSDYELFQLSCKQNRVKCEKILILLKEKKPDFYNTLINSK